MSRQQRWNSQTRQIAIGGGVIGLVGIGIILLWLGRRIPGLFGEWLGLIAGIVSTPFLMEGAFIVLGFMIVLALNGWRQHRDGDECVYLEQVEGPGTEQLPEQARFATYRELPETDLVTLDELDAIEGALEASDPPLAASLLAELDAERLAEPRVIELRIRLAEASGQIELARKLAGQRAGH